MEIRGRSRIPLLVLRDAWALTKVCGPAVAARWLWQLVVRAGECRREASLAPADRGIGPGPFRARLRGARATLYGEDVLAGLREIWARDVYLRGGFLTLPSQAVVLDLGAHVGTFTLLALAHGGGVRVVCVEPVHSWLPSLEEALLRNGWRDRALVINAFVGGRTVVQEGILAAEQARDVPFLSEDDLIRRSGLTAIDFLKCDIEGSEFDLLVPGSRLLGMTRQIAVEVHKWVGDAGMFADRLRAAGFELEVSDDSPASSILLGRRRLTERPEAAR